MSQRSALGGIGCTRSAATWRGWLIGTVAAMALTHASWALAAEDQWVVAAEAGSAWLDDFGSGFQGGVRLGRGLGDFLEPNVRLSGSVHPEGQFERRLRSASLGLDYRLDVIEWVPVLGLRGGVVAAAGGAPAARGAMLGGRIGLDRLLTREWAAGIVFDYDRLLDDSRNLLGVHFALSYHWAL